MSSRNHKEVHGNKRHVANTAGMEQRSKYQNEITKKKRIGDYPKQPNRRQGDSRGTTPSLMGHHQLDYFFNVWNDGFREHAPRKGFHIAVMVMYIYQ
jgi:hypothetical protein